jgi:hypothetical protein
MRRERRAMEKRRDQGVPGPALQLNNNTRRNIEYKVQGFSSEQLVERFHGLVDKRLNESLKLMEAIELDRIEARLNSEDNEEMNHVTEFRDEWVLERGELLASIERIVAGLKSA